MTTSNQPVNYNNCRVIASGTSSCSNGWTILETLSATSSRCIDLFSTRGAADSALRTRRCYDPAVTAQKDGQKLICLYDGKTLRGCWAEGDLEWAKTVAVSRRCIMGDRIRLKRQKVTLHQAQLHSSLDVL
jgi:hypothetical protein